MKSEINNCEACSEVLMEYIDGHLDESTRQAVLAHLDTCPRCRQEEKELREVMATIDHTPLEQPSTQLREGFERMLRTEMALENAPDSEIATENNKRGPVSTKGRLLSLPRNTQTDGRPSIWRPLIQVAAACVLLAVGIAIGSRMRGGGDGASSGPNDQISQLQSEVKDMRQTLMFNLLKQESASERIKGVNYAEQIPHPNGQVLQALITTLNHDKNVNVRLASLYSLSKFSDNPIVRDSLLGSLKVQTEPIIQIVMINILTESGEARAAGPIRDILDNQNTMPEVKNIAREGLKKL